VIILFPLHLLSVHWLSSKGIEGGIIGWMASLLGDGFSGIGGLTFVSPIKLVTKPVVAMIQNLCADIGIHPLFQVALAVAFIFVALRYLVKTLRSLVVTRLDGFFNEILFRNALRGFGFGLVLTIMVQSSSITTSLAVPLAAAGLLTLRQIFPYTLGANVGTTVTAILASFATGNIVAVTTAFSHLLFNLLGIGLICPFSAVRRIPLWLAEGLSAVAAKNRLIPIFFILVVFYLLPLALIALMR